MRSLNFTKQAIDALVLPPGKKRDFFADTKVAGLQIMVTDKGVKSFKVTRKHQGRLIRVTLGRYPDMTIELARRKACETLTTIASGVNPNDAKRKVRHEITFGDMVRDYIDNYAKKHTKRWEDSETLLNRLASGLYGRRASSITTRDLMELHARVGDVNGRYIANRLIERIRAVYNKSMEWGWEGQNPVRNIKKYAERSRDRFLYPEEMPRFIQAVAAEPNITARDVIFMALFTGARKDNVLKMRWDQINLHAGVWRIPETKNGEPQFVALVPQAVRLLEARMNLVDGSPWVFPGDGKAGCFHNPNRAWIRVLKRAGIQNLRLHDLRRTLGSWQAANGANTYVIGKSLGHKSPASTAIYARLNLDPVRESVTKATEAMMNAGDINIPTVANHGTALQMA